MVNSLGHMSAIQVDKLIRDFDDFRAVNEISFEVHESEIFGFLGPNGAGKTTTINILCTLLRPTGGSAQVNGYDVSSRQSEVRSSIGIIFQDHQLLFDRPVFDNVALPLLIQGYRRAEIARRTRAALDKVGLLHKEKSMPITLSGGEQQRVGIARAVVHKPMVLLADEPTGNLDPVLSREIMQIFIDFNQVGVTVMVASHDLALIDELDKPRMTLERGQLILNDLDTTQADHDWQ